MVSIKYLKFSRAFLHLTVIIIINKAPDKGLRPPATRTHGTATWRAIRLEGSQRAQAAAARAATMSLHLDRLAVSAVLKAAAVTLPPVLEVDRVAVRGRHLKLGGEAKAAFQGGLANRGHIALNSTCPLVERFAVRRFAHSVHHPLSRVA